jgi:diadenosine tetraphosphate (Ap4A) HIT family hydrolase
LTDACYSCAQEAILDTVPDAERVWVGEHWRVAHCIRCALPYWMVVLPRRHTISVAEHTAAEAAELGEVLVALSAALERVTGCPKTYVVQFAEASGFSHVHFHVVPRPAELPPERRGPGIFYYLGRPESEHLPDAERDRLARLLRPVLAEEFARRSGQS